VGRDRGAIPLAADPVGAEGVEIDDEKIRPARRLATREEEREREHHSSAVQ
jgi:hypothetical protein